jgi:hypothetical protein
MRTVVMQPYFFPYLGYFQLLAVADVFVVFEDVHFIKKGWIHRNRILVDGAPKLFTVPLAGASQNRRIHELEVHDGERWGRAFLASLQGAYARAPHYRSAIEVVRESLPGAGPTLVADLAVRSVRNVAEYVGLSLPPLRSSRDFGNAELKGQARIIDICRRVGARTYVNPASGERLYQLEAFEDAGMELHFLAPELEVYRQFGGEFVPYLSVIDVLMFNPPERVGEWMRRGRVRPPGPRPSALDDPAAAL